MLQQMHNYNGGVGTQFASILLYYIYSLPYTTGTVLHVVCACTCTVLIQFVQAPSHASFAVHVLWLWVDLLIACMLLVLWLALLDSNPHLCLLVNTLLPASTPLWSMVLVFLSLHRACGNDLHACAEKSTCACVQLTQVMGQWGGAYPSWRQYSDCKPILEIEL